MTVQLAPVPLFKAFDNNGLPLFGGQLYSYVAGTTTPQATYVDSTQTTQNTNPVILNWRGEASVWLDVSKTYKLVLEDQFANLIWSVDNIVGGQVPTAQSIGMLLYPQTAAEMAAGVTPMFYNYAPGNVLRYQPSGQTDFTQSITYATQQCAQAGGNAVFFPASSATYVVNGTIPINGPLYMVGETDRMSNKGPTINQQTSGSDTFTVTGPQATGFSITCENLGFMAGSATAPAGTAFFYINTVSNTVNSLYWKNCWFQSPIYYALNISYADDIQIEGCTFDTTGEKWLAFGLNGLCTNVSVTYCTISDTGNQGLCDLGNVDGFVFSDNRCYSNTGANLIPWIGATTYAVGTKVFYLGINYTCIATSTNNAPPNATYWSSQGAPAYGVQSPYGINMVSYAVSFIKNVIIDSNFFKGYNSAMAVASLASQVVFNANTVDLVWNAPAVAFSGGTLVQHITISNNSLAGYAGTGFGMIDATATPYEYCTITDNSLLCSLGGASSYGINAPAASTTFNKHTGNVVYGATAGEYALINYVNNGIINSGTFAITTTGMSGATGTGKFTVNGNTCTIFIPALSGAAAASTTATIIGLPSYIWPLSTSNYATAVISNSVSVAGNLSITSSATLTLSVGSAGGAFNGAGNNGVQAMTVTYSLN